MNQTRTTTALLESLLDSENLAVWQEFDARFRPIVEAVARRLGLGDHDAADVAQETLTSFLRDYRAGKYQRERGRLSAWIVGIARHRVAELRRSRARQREWRGDSAFDELPSEGELTELFDRECREELLRKAFAALRATTRLDERTICVFEQLSLAERTPADVAREQNLTLDSVYAARSRCMHQLRQILADLQRAYELG